MPSLYTWVLREVCKMITALQESSHSSTSEFFEVQLHSGTTTTVEEEGVTGETSFSNSKSKKGEWEGESPEWPEVSKGFETNYEK